MHRRPTSSNHRPRKAFFARAVRLFLAATLGAHPAAMHAQGNASEMAVKAAFVYHFTQFVEWPSGAFSSASAPIVVGVCGSGAMVRALNDAVDGKSANGRRLVVREVGANVAGEKIQLLFVANGTDLRRIGLDSLREKPVLVVGESPGFARRGGHLNLLIEQGRVTFELNLNAAKAAGFSVSAKLIRLAKAVIS